MWVIVDRSLDVLVVIVVFCVVVCCVVCRFVWCG